MAEKRNRIPARIEVALWALSNGRCYAPGCPFPVMYEVRPGVYYKNVQIAHIHGVRGPRFKQMPEGERDSFGNLILLCLAHHSAVDDRKVGEKFYPPDLLRKWKAEREGQSGPALAELGPIGEEGLTDLLAEVFTPPVERLEAVADRLEKTGTLNQETVAELRQIVGVMADTDAGLNARMVAQLTQAAEIFGDSRFVGAAHSLADAADKLPKGEAINQLENAAKRIADLLGRHEY